MAIQVLIASDQPILRKGLSALLESARIHVVGEATDGQEAARLAGTCRPDVVVLDLNGHSFSELVVVQKILQISAGTKIILLTVRGEDQDVLPALQAGISGYVLKTDVADLAQAIQEVSRGTTYLSRSVSSAAVCAYLTSTEPAAERPHGADRPDHRPDVEAQITAATIRAPGTALGQRRLTAIMFTDMVGYSALTRKSEPLALELVEQHNVLLRQRFMEYGGREIKAMGDGFMVVFASALDAVRCAVVIQSAVHERNANVPPGQGFHVRIGVHVGDVVHRGDDVFGDGVNIASRIECLARPGGICVSEQVVNLIRHAIGRPLIKLGNAALKNIPTPVRVYYVGLPWEEHPVPLRDRLSFACFHKRRTLSFADLTNAAFVATVAGLVIWQSIAEHKAIHAMVWFGEGPPAETRPPDPPRMATLSLADATLGRDGAVPRENALAGAVPALERRFAAADHNARLLPATQTPDLLTLMVKRDLGRTFHFARHYDRIGEQLRTPAGNAPLSPPVPAQGKHASVQQAIFAEVFAWTTRSDAADVPGRIP
jgi:class 3 adenylate cyclase/CheY-like chemotaxis protein